MIGIVHLFYSLLGPEYVVPRVQSHSRIVWGCDWKEVHGQCEG